MKISMRRSMPRIKWWLTTMKETPTNLCTMVRIMEKTEGLAYTIIPGQAGWWVAGVHLKTTRSQDSWSSKWRSYRGRESKFSTNLALMTMAWWTTTLQSFRSIHLINTSRMKPTQQSPHKSSKLQVMLPFCHQQLWYTLAMISLVLTMIIILKSICQQAHLMKKLLRGIGMNSCDFKSSKDCSINNSSNSSSYNNNSSIFSSSSSFNSDSNSNNSYHSDSNSNSNMGIFIPLKLANIMDQDTQSRLSHKSLLAWFLLIQKA